MVPTWLKKFQNGSASFYNLFSSYLAQSSLLGLEQISHSIHRENVHISKMDFVSNEERDDFLLRSQFKRHVMYVYSLWYSF